MQKLTLPIQVGKKYVRRDGEVVVAKPPCHNRSTACVFIGTDEVHEDMGGVEHAWIENGLIHGKSASNCRDLVADYVEVTGHVHAELMAEYAKDAAKSKEPWKDWEISASFDSTYWISCTRNPGWDLDRHYRRKPKTVTINGIVVNKGLTEANYDTLVYIPALHLHEKYIALRFEDAFKRGLERGLAHATKEDAIAMADAMLAFSHEAV